MQTGTYGRLYVAPIRPIIQAQQLYQQHVTATRQHANLQRPPRQVLVNSTAEVISSGSYKTKVTKGRLHCEHELSRYDLVTMPDHHSTKSEAAGHSSWRNMHFKTLCRLPGCPPTPLARKLRLLHSPHDILHLALTSRYPPRLFHAAVVDYFAGSPEPLGPSRIGSTTNFAVFSHASTAVSLVLQNPEDSLPQEIPMHKSGLSLPVLLAYRACVHRVSCQQRSRTCVMLLMCCSIARGSAGSERVWQQCRTVMQQHW